MFSSVCTAYPLPQIPFSEADVTDSPASLYAATKKSNELLAHSYSYIYGISVTGLRFFTVYGPWGRPDMAAFSFTRAILKARESVRKSAGARERAPGLAWPDTGGVVRVAPRARPPAWRWRGGKRCLARLGTKHLC